MFKPLSLEKYSPDRFAIYVSREVRAGTPNYREVIRAEIGRILSAKGDNFKRLLDLERLPSYPDVGVSIAHCPEASCFALDFSGTPIGIDVEKKSRVSLGLLQRICTQREIGACPEAAHLFTAKEAIWKALNQERRWQVISQFEVGDWTHVDKGLYSFTLPKEQSKPIYQGVSTSIYNCSLSVFPVC
jgi:4'-phosphopantetheinyl transferase EntD